MYTLRPGLAFVPIGSSRVSLQVFLHSPPPCSTQPAAMEAWMELQMAAIFGNLQALVDIARVAAEVGPNPTDAERVAVWQRLSKEDAEKQEEIKFNDGGGAMFMQKVNDESLSGRLEGSAPVCKPTSADEKLKGPKADENLEAKLMHGHFVQLKVH